MKQIPILFSTPMVQAILEGRKTMTRRIVKPQPKVDSQTGDHLMEGFGENITVAPWEEYQQAMANSSFCPYGKPGDILWVRETSKVETWNAENYSCKFRYKASPDDEPIEVEFDDFDRFENLQLKLINKLDAMGIHPEVDEDNEQFSYNWEKNPFKWTPGIHMPKEAARIWLEVVSVRVERLQDIDNNDAEAEGVEQAKGWPFWFLGYDEDIFKYQDAKPSFKSLWHKINGEESWNANPWVWVIEFKRIEKP